MKEFQSEQPEEQKEIKYFLDFTPLSHQIGGENCYKIEITHDGVLGSRVITQSEVKALEDSADDTPKRIALLKKYWADSPKTGF